jgi:hypothetical protein
MIAKLILKKSHAALIANQNKEDRYQENDDYLFAKLIEEEVLRLEQKKLR